MGVISFSFVSYLLKQMKSNYYHLSLYAHPPPFPESYQWWKQLSLGKGQVENHIFDSVLVLKDVTLGVESLLTKEESA